MDETQCLVYLSFNKLVLNRVKCNNLLAIFVYLCIGAQSTSQNSYNPNEPIEGKKDLSICLIDVFEDLVCNFEMWLSRFV